MGTYIGHRSLDGSHQAMDVRNTPSLEQSWLHALQLGISPTLVSSNSHLANTIPWLLYHHDDRRTRNHILAQNLTSPSRTTAMTTMTATLYILGDCLEWLMQVTSVNQAVHPLMCKHLQQQSLTYPAAITPKVHSLIASLEFPSSITDDYQLQSSNELTMTLAAAIRQSLTYSENLALALSTCDLGTPTSTLIGCLLGAWRGTSIIPSGWLTSLPNTSKQTLHQVAEQLYRNWAGINHISATFEAFPLDL